MNREILFRGKNIDDGHWVYGTPISLRNGETHMNFEFMGWIDRAIVITETVGQYTGLTDKNGTRIFERDIIVAKHPGQKNAVPYLVGYGVYKDEDSFDDCRYLGFHLKALGKCCSILTPLSDRIKYEVIGNIYDNAELLEDYKNNE